MRIKLIQNRADIPFTSIEWNKLVSQNETNTIFQTYEWFDSWWKTFGEMHELFFLTIYDNNEIAGFAPLMLTNNPKYGRTLSFVGDSNSDYLDFILPTNKKSALISVCEFLRNNSSLWDVISLLNIPEHSQTRTLLDEICRQANLYCMLNDRTACPALTIKNNEKSTRHIINKYSTKRSFNYFNRQGDLKFHHITDKDELTKYLPIFFEQHIARWESTRNESLFNNRRNREFYQKLASNLLTTGYLLFTVVELDEVPLSFHFGFDYNSNIIWYKPSFNIHYASHSPGILLIRYLIQYALNNNKTEIDFTIGDEPFKARFTNKNRTNYNYVIFNSPRKYRLNKTLRGIRNTIKRLIKRR